jgi:hypothetical protein
MSSNLKIVSLALLLGASLTAWPCDQATAAGKKVTLVGDVFDSACLFTRGLKKPISHECALECAAGGSPLVILGQDGFVYWPVDDQMPAQGQNHRLIKYGAKTVKVTGEVYERGASRAIVIRSIEEVKPAASVQRRQ